MNDKVTPITKKPTRNARHVYGFLSAPGADKMPVMSAGMIAVGAIIGKAEIEAEKQGLDGDKDFVIAHLATRVFMAEQGV